MERLDSPERRAPRPEKRPSGAISRGKTAVVDGMSRQRYHWHNGRRKPGWNIKKESDMLLEILLLLSLCVGLPVLIGHVISAGGRDER
jgi:hypothetical protein